MELKKYQQHVIDDLIGFLEIWNGSGSAAEAYETFWQKTKNVPVGKDGLPSYNDAVKGVPHVCFKVPTGGGKTFLACNAIKPVFDALEFTKNKAVVWLVPSDAILEQTLKNLRDTSHPYRQKIDLDFSGRVEVYTKEELLNGQGFNPTSVSEQLSIFVLSFDSFRTNKKDGRKAYQENGNLAQFARANNKETAEVKGADPTSLIEVIHDLKPLVIVDESHHAKSDLSVDMLQNMNPRFIIDLTATPRENSNVISFVDALQLKSENMVKLPVIVYNRKSQKDVFIDALNLRTKLEAHAISESKGKDGKYIRPIVLFQAEPKNAEDSTTFEEVKKKLIDFGVPENQIAIKTSKTDDLKNVDLLSEDCEIRYIITVNALKEGWDCPFAYILATLANRSSSVDVEQILGRILRQPYTREYDNEFLNMSYVITSSEDFQLTLGKIVDGMNNAGFSSRDCRVGEDEPVSEAGETTRKGGLFDKPVPVTEPEKEDKTESESAPADDAADFDAKPADVNLDPEQAGQAGDDLADAAAAQSREYEKQTERLSGNNENPGLPPEVKAMQKCASINSEFREETEHLLLPQFFIEVPSNNIFRAADAKDYRKLSKEYLSDGFSLKGKDSQIDFNAPIKDLYMVDVAGEDDATVRRSKLNQRQAAKFMEEIAIIPPSGKISYCKSKIYDLINKNNLVDAKELRKYINDIIDNFDKNRAAEMESSLFTYAERIRLKIDSMLNEHREKTFREKLAQNKIICQPSYNFPVTIPVPDRVSSGLKSLYSDEGNMNTLEQDVIMSVDSVDSVEWWHRNEPKTEFGINGYINDHYPDFIVRLKSGLIIVLETKGDHLDNEDSRKKAELGREWQIKAGDDKYKYFMVFEKKNPKYNNCTFSTEEFLKILQGM